MAEWSRETPWRQGHVIPPNAAIQLGLCGADNVATCIPLVIGHDCDIAASADQEPSVEVVIGSFVPALDGNYTHAKNARQLHLQLEQGEASIAANLNATAKAAVAKAALAEYGPRADLHLTPPNKAILQRWLSARYRRSAFPDEFDRRLDKSGLKKKLAKVLSASGTHVRALYFDLDEGRDLAREGDGDVYTLEIVILYDAAEDGAFEAATKVKDEVEAAFADKFRLQDQTWKTIELRDCMVIADTAMSVAQSSVLREWRAEYLSLREDPAGAMLQA